MVDLVLGQLEMSVNKLLALCLCLCLFFAGCVAGPNPAVYTMAVDGGQAGFFMGIWHGFIVFLTFIISLFTNDVTIYEIHNSGGWYDFGFMIGSGLFFGSGSSGVKRRAS